MFYSQYTAKIATWVYNSTTTNDTIVTSQALYLDTLTQYNWFNLINTNTFNWLSQFLVSVLYVLLVTITILIVNVICSNNNSNTSTLGQSTTFLQLIEDELSGGTKLIYVYISLFGYIIWFFLYSYIGFSLPWVAGILPLYGFLLVFLLFGVPVMLLVNYKSFFMTYIRGNVGLKPLLMELILDYINLIAFFLRFNIQLIRILIITAIFFLYNELFEEFIYPNYTNVTLNFNLTALLLIFANLLYEVGHFWIIFGMQSSATLFILTILFQFLYTQVFYNKFQNFFVTKRK